MKIEISKDQYLTLLKAMYLGIFMSEDCMDAESDDDDFYKLDQYILSLAKDFGMETFVEEDEGEFYPSAELDEMMAEYIDDYNDNNFWDELTNRLARRDVVKEVGEKKFVSMEILERLELEHPVIEKYIDEFEKNGIENLEVKGLK